MHGYNRAFHRSIKRTLASGSAQNEVFVSEDLYGKLPKHMQPKLRIGGIVRINKTKRNLEKGYLPNWTQELFKITGIRRQLPVTYITEDLGQKQVKGAFYSQEIQRVDSDHICEIDSVLAKRRRKVGGNKWVKEVKVHWKGYPSRFDSWIY